MAKAHIMRPLSRETVKSGRYGGSQRAQMGRLQTSSKTRQETSNACLPIPQAPPHPTIWRGLVERMRHSSH